LYVDHAESNRNTEQVKKQKNLVKFGKNVQYLRLKRGWSQELLADKADCHRNYIGFIERAERAASIEKAIAIAKALGCSSNEIFKGLIRH